MLTFVSPTVIVGDKSQVYITTNEMAHSWTGNTVTCADWSNLWLNKGFSVYIERKASEHVNGIEFSKVGAYIGNQTAYKVMEDYGYWNSYSSLHPNIGSDQPDKSSSIIPYEKGFQFMSFLESLIDERLLTMLIDEYVHENAYTSIKW